MDRAPLFRTLSRRLAALSVGALLFTTGCVYDNHANYGATEKWVHSDIHTIPKIIATPFLSIVDGIISPFTMCADQFDIDWGIERAPVYHPDHHYFSYSGSRVIGRSDMSEPYKWVCSIPSIIIETLWLIVTGPVDLVTVLVDDDGISDDTGVIED